MVVTIYRLTAKYFYAISAQHSIVLQSLVTNNMIHLDSNFLLFLIQQCFFAINSIPFRWVKEIERLVHRNETQFLTHCNLFR